MIQPSQQSIGIDIDCAEGRVYWSDIAGKKIDSATFRGGDVKRFVTLGVYCQDYVTTSKSTNYNLLGSQSLIMTYYFVEDIGSVEGLSIDWLSRNIYWTDSSKDTIEVASLDNSSLRKVLISDGLVNPRGIAVHPSRG